MKNFRWLVVALTFVAIIINYLDRTALAYAIAPLQQTFKLNNAEFGIIAAGFGVGYLLMTVGGGVLVDHCGARRVWSLTAICWSIACAIMSLATGFWTLFCWRLLLGIAEGPTFPALNRVIADWLPAPERARALSMSLAAVPLASVIGAPLIAHLILAVGWRVMFVALGSLGLLWALLWYLLFRDRPSQSRAVSAAEATYINSGQPQARSKERQIALLEPALLANHYAFFSFGYLLFFALTWLPGYFEQVYGLNLKALASFLIAPWLGGALLIVVGGMLSDWLLRKTGRLRAARSHLIWSCQLLSALCFVPVIMYHSLTISIIFISLGISLGLMPNAAFFVLNVDLNHARAATSAGIMDAAFAAAGILAPVCTGILTHLTGNFNAALGLLIFFSVSSALCVLLWQQPDAQMTSNLTQ